MSNEQQNASPAGQSKQAKRGGNLLSWVNLVLIVILFLLAGFAGWLGWQGWAFIMQTSCLGSTLV